VSRYTLVTYDENEVVESTATGLYRHPNIWLFPIIDKDLDLHLAAGDFFLGIDNFDRHINIAANPARRDSYLQLPRSSSGCIAVIGSNSNITLDTVALDGRSPMQLPFRWLNIAFDTKNQNYTKEDKSKNFTQQTDYHALAAFTLNQGEHSLEISNSGYRGKKSITIECRQGDILYVVVKGEKDLNAKSMKWDIKLSKSMPDIFVGRPLIISRDHQWLVEKEPISIK
jgi:hypothetical protein